MDKPRRETAPPFFREPANTLIRLHFVKRDKSLCAALSRLERMPKKVPSCSCLAFRSRQRAASGIFASWNDRGGEAAGRTPFKRFPLLQERGRQAVFGA